jgi:hypothetical protein
VSSILGLTNLQLLHFCTHCKGSPMILQLHPPPSPSFDQFALAVLVSSVSSGILLSRTTSSRVAAVRAASHNGGGY